MVKRFPINKKLYEKNLNLLRQIDALTAYKLQFSHFDSIQFCETEQHELNLFQIHAGHPEYYHSQTGALQEAQQALEDQTLLEEHEVFYFYGLGLAYIYEALTPWLKENPQHHLIFLEDELEVLHHFLYTERATKILQDKQVTIFYFENDQSEMEFVKFHQLHSQFINRKIYFLALPSYVWRYNERSFILCYRILYDHSLMSLTFNEYLSGQSGFINNFYRNFLSFPECYLGSHLFGKFKGIPAIICGAGPSLEKNVHLLKDLSDRALIFAGGSSLNVLNAYGITPHFGLGIDPNPEQYHRFLTNHSFHLPLFFRARMAHDAFKMVNGPKLYIPGSIHQLPAWFEKKLGIEAPKIDEGHNVVNFCTEIAYFMGCNPLIYVGMDLAFTEVKTYAPGISTHPIWLGSSTPYSHQKKQVILRKGVQGELVKTKWDWILESDWLNHYAKNHPHIQMINATEGGLGFHSVPNRSLSQVADIHLKKSYDLHGLIHLEIQNSPLNIDVSSLLKLMIEFKNSLDQCLLYCKKIYTLQETHLKSEKKTDPLISPEFALYETLLQEEVAYQHFLNLFENAHQFLEKAASRKDPSTPLQRYPFLIFVIEQHIFYLTRSIQLLIASPPPVVQRNLSPSPVLHSAAHSYSMEKDRLTIRDEQLQIEWEEPFKPLDSDKITEWYPNGQLKMEIFYQEGQLHGPSRFYTDKGGLIAESWFIRGKKQGISRLFYPSGNLYAIERYKEGKLHLEQEYFFEKGTPYLVSHYAHGVLEGEVLIYHYEGNLWRELHYKQGQRDGVERLWNQDGVLLIECHYDNGIPIGTAHQWTQAGILEREVIIHQYPKDFDLQVWNPQGKLIRRFVHGVEDFSFYYEETKKQIEFLDQSIHLILDHITRLTAQKEGMISQEISENLSQLNEQIKHLEKMKIDLLLMNEENLQKNLEAQHKQVPNHE